MDINGVTSPTDIAISGMRAEGLRMRVVANNIANAHTTRTDEGGPYRRQELAVRAGSEPVSGVRIDQILSDTARDFQRIYMPGHPDADGEGFVQMPNVDVPQEMMHMLTASRAYQANVASLRRYQDMMEATMELLR
jgi:flagellar basal-body rod protein FlgC